jgi:hypothetical protein
MGYVDAQCLLSDAQAVTADAASTNTYDTDSSTNDIGVGEPLVVEFSIDVAADGTTTDETYEFQVISSAAANLGTPTILSQRTIGYATLVAGYKFWLPIPSGKVLRYVGAYYNVGGTSPTVTVTANIKPQSMVEELKYYPKAYTIGA